MFREVFSAALCAKRWRSQLEEADARRLVEQKREGSKLKIVLDGQQIPVQIKEKAVNLLNNDILHLSFQALQADQK